FFLALLYYIRIRQSGRRLGVWETLVLLLLFMIGINAKEMMVTLPGVLVLYELIYERGGIRERLRQSIVPLLLLLAAVVFIVRKPTGAGALTAAYQPRYTLDRALENLRPLLGCLFYLGGPVPIIAVVVFFASLAALAFLLRSRPLQLG